MARPQAQRIRVILGLDREHVPSLCQGARLVHDGMSANVAIFPAPSPSMAELLGLIVALEQANQRMRGYGVAAARDVQRDLLWSALESERACVQRVCDASPESAILFATTAGMKVAMSSRHGKALLTVTLMPQKGSVHLVANASMLVATLGRKLLRRTFLWRYTLDGGITFFQAEASPVAETVIEGLPLMVEVGFQVALKDSRGATPWSQTVTLLVY